MRSLLVLATTLVACPLLAATATVGCPGGTPGTFTTITAAAASLDLDGPHTITVSGTCSESVVLDQRERLTLQGPATINGVGNNPGVTLRNSGHVLLRDLTVRGLRAAISIENQSSATLQGIVAENATGAALDAFGGATLVVGGNLASQAVTLRNSTNGMRCEACVAFLAGFVTAENNANFGLLIDSGRIEAIGQQPASLAGPAQGGPTIIRNNFNGVSVTSGGHFELARVNTIENNAASGIILNGSTASILGNFLPDGTPAATTFQGNQRNAASALFNSTLRMTGPHQLVGNGAPGVDFRAGISATHGSVVFMGGVTITGSTGPGIALDSTATARLDNMTISGNTEEGIRLLHGAVFESFAANTIPAPSVTCDGTTIVFGDLTGIAPFDCAKDKKK